MKKTLLVLLAALGLAGCGKKPYLCQKKGDASKLAEWQARGFVTDGPQTQICEASADNFEAIYTAPKAGQWLAVHDELGKALAKRGWGDSPRADAVQRDARFGVSDSGSERDLEKCGAPQGKLALVTCTDRLMLHIEALPTEWKDNPYRVKARLLGGTHRYVRGRPF